MKKTVVAGLGACAVALAFAAKDPVIMTVNGVDVPQSEFEYLYNKNSQQQINPQTLEEYVEMFKLYKMKVADAKAERLDTLPSFIKETEQYRHDLSAPYLTDSLFINQLVKEAYDRSQEEVEAYHIMLFKGRDAKTNAGLRQRIDSIHGVLKAGGDFAALAKQYSQDRGSLDKGGRMGYMVAGSYPYAFEIAAYTTPLGEISEVVESPVGYHILKGGKHRPARGKVQAAHILKLTRDMTPEQKAAAKRSIDSLYNVVVANPEIFGEVASKNSDDKGSARQGGMLPLFGAGEMVEVFDSVAFALADNEISKPFESQFGYHIVKKTGSRPVPAIEKMKTATISRMNNPSDPRFKMIRDRQTADFAKKHKASLNKGTLTSLREAVKANGLDSIFFDTWTKAPFATQVLATVDGKKVPVSEFITSIKAIRQPLPEAALSLLNDNLDSYYNGLLVSAEEDALAEKEPDYRNLLREYVDGSLLYEVSVRKVWDKAAKDTEGLAKYFEANRANYKWSDPHAKGYLVQAANDSVAGLVKARAAELGRDSLVNTIRKEFGRQVAIDKVLVSKGTNPMVDNLMFEAAPVKPSNNYQVYFMLDGRLIDAPEEVADVRGLVTSDYQNVYQEAWENELRKKYPVKVNDAVLKRVKRIEKK